MTRTRLAALLLAVLALAGAACGGSDDKDAASTTTTSTTASSDSGASTSTTAASAGVLEILVTNDDGYASNGIDAVVEALRAEPETHVTVVAPYENESGTGDKTTPGTLVTHEVKTASGYDAIGVEGFPADTVIEAIDVLGLKPDLVVSGTNEGQNIGPFTTISGTVGAAKQAVRKGIPAFASSTGMVKDHPFDHAVAAKVVVDWVREHRAALLDGTALVEIRNLNVPTCVTGTLRGVVEVPLATDFKGRDASIQDCTSTKPEADLVDDVDAFAHGFAPITLAPAS
jgi:5'-nucleotidase